MALAQRPRLAAREASSLPRNGPWPLRTSNYFNNSDDNSDGDETQTDALPTRGAIDIVKGLEKKRQRRKEKLHEKAARMKAHRKPREEAVLPGVGAEKMKRMGEGLCRMRGHGFLRKPEGAFENEDRGGEGGHILSY